MPITTGVMAWGAIAISVLSSLAFFVALIIAHLAQDQTNQSLMIGAVIANFTTTVSFWLGSSFGSQKKDEALARLPPAQIGTTATKPIP